MLPGDVFLMALPSLRPRSLPRTPSSHAPLRPRPRSCPRPCDPAKPSTPPPAPSLNLLFFPASPCPRSLPRTPPPRVPDPLPPLIPRPRPSPRPCPAEPSTPLPAPSLNLLFFPLLSRSVPCFLPFHNPLLSYFLLLPNYSSITSALLFIL